MREVLHSTKSTEGKKWCACRINGTRENQKPTLALQSALWQQPEIEREKLSCRFNCLCALLINLTWFDVCYHLIRHFESFHFPLFSCYSYSHSLVGRTDTIQNCIVRKRTHTHLSACLFHQIAPKREWEREGERELNEMAFSRFQMQFN